MMLKCGRTGPDRKPGGAKEGEMGISLFYNADCPRCARQAARTCRMDWLHRVEPRTDESPLGEVPVGKIVVVDKDSKRAFTGAFATRKVCLQIPLLLPLGLVLFLPPVLRLVGRGNIGCDGEAREI